MAKVLLGISPGTRTLGLAVLANGELVEWKVKTFKEAWSWSKREAILGAIAQVCAYHGVTQIAMKRLDPLRSSPQLAKLYAAIKRFGLRQNIYVWQFSLDDLDYDNRETKEPTKRQLSREMAHKYPELKIVYEREKENRTEYHTKMFEAVAIAERCDS